MRNFLDRDFIKTTEGLFFCVVGSIHPFDRVISYIKYIPADLGLWGNKENKFERLLKNYTIPDLLKTFQFIEKNYPQYLFHSTKDNITITAVPHKYIKTHFMPEKKLAKLRQASELDTLQHKLIRFTKFLEEISGVSENSFGVTGSLLLDIHQPSFSDIDVIVYGKKESWTLKDALTTNRKSKSSMKYLEGKALHNWSLKKSKQYPLTIKEASRLYERKWNLGFFEDKYVSIHPAKIESEVTEKYEEKNYIPYGQVKLKAVVEDNIDSLFLPAIYQIRDVEFLSGQQFEDVKEIVTYESLYDSLAELGEKIEVKGKLEKIFETRKKRQHYRVVVGSAEGKGLEYIKLVE